MFGIKIDTFRLRRRCDACGHEHDCKAHAVASTVPKHLKERRPIRSRFAWWAGEGSDHE
jgi:hypothetical protein